MTIADYDIIMRVIADNMPGTVLRKYINSAGQTNNVIHFGYPDLSPFYGNYLSIDDTRANYNHSTIDLRITVGSVKQDDKTQKEYYISYMNGCRCKINLIADDPVEKLEESIGFFLYDGRYLSHGSKHGSKFPQYIIDLTYKFGLKAINNESKLINRTAKPLFVACSKFGIRQEYASLFYTTDAKLWFSMLKHNKDSLEYDDKLFNELLNNNYHDAACIYLSFCKHRNDVINDIIIHKPNRLVDYCLSIREMIFKPEELQKLNPLINDKFVKFYTEKLSRYKNNV